MQEKVTGYNTFESQNGSRYAPGQGKDRTRKAAQDYCRWDVGRYELFPGSSIRGGTIHVGRFNEQGSYFGSRGT